MTPFNPFDVRAIAQEPGGNHFLQALLIISLIMIGLNLDKSRNHQDIGTIGTILAIISLYGLRVILP